MSFALGVLFGHQPTDYFIDRNVNQFDQENARVLAQEIFDKLT